MNPILEVSHLSKFFGSGKNIFKAIDDISFSVGEGEILGLLGPNGAGKTTTVHMVLGLTTPTSGMLSFFGKDFSKHRSEILKRINFGASYLQFPWNMTVWENLDVFARIYEVESREKRIDEVLTIFDMSAYKHKTIGSLSSGQMVRIVLAKSLINHPKLLILDEPTAFLDPEISQKVREFLLHQQKEFGLSILFTSHNMIEVEEICDRVIFLHHGKILAEDTPRGLAARSNKSELRLMIIDGLKRLVSECQTRGYKVVEERRFVRIYIPESDIPNFLKQIGDLEIEYSEIEISKPSLEDFFLSVVNKEKYEQK